MKKLPAVDRVRVSLNDGLTILDLKPENSVTLAQLRQIIKNSGFVSKDVNARARGIVAADQKTFTVSGTRESLTLSAPPQQVGDEWGLAVAAPRR
jgi:hypothetical protein